MKYALHASLHRPARRPDQTVGRDGSDRAAVDFSSDDLTERTLQRQLQADPSEAAAPFRPLAFSPPPPTMTVNAHGKPAMISSTLPPMATDHDRPTLRFPVVPPPVTPPQLNVPEPLIDINEPTLEEKPVRMEKTQDPTQETTRLDPRAEIAERQTEEIESPLAAGTYPGDLSDDPQDAEELEDAEEDRGAKTRITSLQPRKKGQPPRKLARAHGTTPPASQDTSDGVPRQPHIEPIDPAAWLADEAQARTSDRRDAADGVDNSDAFVPLPRTRPNVV
jgi:hypothetical protein